MSLQRPFVVLPTYNERENLAKMVPALFGLPVLNLSVLVVDDSSPDGTGDLVKELQTRYKSLFLLSRTRKEGLGKAYVAGFQEAIQKGADCIVQMDADFSHNPKDVPRLLASLSHADLAIGSRYIKGGGTKNWPFLRFFLSWFANIYARFVTRISLYDLTGGFKAWRRSSLEKIDFRSIQTNGYGFQIETTFKAFKKGFCIKEIPITFTERRLGQSKMSRRIIWEALWLVWKLRLKA